MKKSIFKKIGGLFLGLAMGLGVVVGVTAGNKASEVKAASEEAIATFDFEDDSAHRTSGSNSFGTNTYKENGVDIKTANGDVVTTGTPIGSSVANFMGRLKKTVTSSSVTIGPIDCSDYKVTKITYDTKGATGVKHQMSYSDGGTSYTSLGTATAFKTSDTSHTETISATGLTLSNPENFYVRCNLSYSGTSTNNQDARVDNIVIYGIKEIAKTNVDITGSNFTMTVGDDDVAPSTNVTGYTLQSSNTSVATIVNNKVHAVSAGTSNITISKAEDSEHTYTSKLITVTVNAAPVVPYINPSKTSASGLVGESQDISFSSGNLTSGVSAVSNNTSVVTASISGSNVHLDFVGAGSTTVSLKDGSNELATISVSVTAPVHVTGVTLNKSSLSLFENGEETLTATVAPSNANNKNVTWSSSASDKASVDQSGKVTAVSAGSAIITVTTSDGNFTATCVVTVKSAPQVVGPTQISTTSSFPENSETSNVSTGSSYQTMKCDTSYLLMPISLFEIPSGKVLTNSFKIEHLGGSYGTWGSPKTFTFEVQLLGNDKATVIASNSGTLTAGSNGASAGSVEVTIPSGTNTAGVAYVKLIYSNMNGTNTGRGVRLYGLKYTYSCEAVPPTIDLVESQSVYTNNQIMDFATVTNANVSDIVYTFKDNGATTASSTSSLVSISNNILTAKSTAGTVVVIATIGDVSASTTITVEEPPASFISLACTHGVYTGEDYSVTATYSGLTGSLSWLVTGTGSVSNTSVDPDVYAGKLLTAGTVTITASDSEGTASDSVTFTITKTEITNIELDVSEAELWIGKPGTRDTVQLTATVTKIGAITEDVTWSSNDDSVATVSDTGLVSAVGIGETVIVATAADGESTATCSISVIAAPKVYQITGPTGDSAGTSLDLDKLKTYFKTTDMNVEWTAVSGSIYGSSTQSMRIGTGSGTGSATLSVKANSGITITKVEVSVKGWSGDSATAKVVGKTALGTSTTKTSSTLSTSEYTLFTADFSDNPVTSIEIGNGTKRVYVNGINVYYSEHDAELGISSSSVEVAVNSSASATLTPSYFTSGDTVTYSAAVKSGTSLTTSNLSFNGNIVTITSGSTNGTTVFSITGKDSHYKQATVELTVIVTLSRSITSLTITNSPSKTTYKVGEELDLTGLVVVAEFDNEPTEVTYSSELGNLGSLEIEPAAGYIFTDGDINSEFEISIYLAVGDGEEMDSFTVSVVDKEYAHQIEDVSELYDGQEVYLVDSANQSKVAGKYVSGNNAPTFDAVTNGKGLCLDDTNENAYAYTIVRHKIDETIYYALSFIDGEGNKQFIKDTGTSSSNSIAAVGEIEDACYFSIEIDEDGVATFKNMTNTAKAYLQMNNTSSVLACYNGGQTNICLYTSNAYSEEIVAQKFVDRYMHLDDYTESLGYCSDSEHDYYGWAKKSYNALSEDEKLYFSENTEAYARLEAWATANGDYFDSDFNLVANPSRINPILALSNIESSTWIIAVIAVAGLTAIGGYFFYKKRKENY